MVLKGEKHKRGLKKVISVLTASAIALGCYGSFLPVSAAEQAEKVYKGINNAQVVLNNLDYYDVKNSGTWATEAIYETGALDVIKGYGDKRFGRTDVVSKEQAIAIAYRVAGREADAQKAAEELDNARKRDQKKTDVLGMWSDGYLKLAADDGLISKEDLADAFNSDPSTLGPLSFYREAPAQRQEMGFWLAKALKLDPAYNQQEIFNSYKDWKDSDPVKVPYLEAALQNNIMNGDGNGYFNPKQGLTREQAAQIVKNADRYMLPALHYEKLTGTIEDIALSSNVSGAQRLETATLNIRNLNGKLHQINVGYSGKPGQSDRNEQNGQFTGPAILDLVVYKNGTITNSSALEKGDRLEYIAAPDNTVKYVKVFSNTADTQYIVAQLKNIDTQKLTLSILPFFTLETPDMTLAQKYASLNPQEKPLDSYIYSNNVSVRAKGRNIDIKSLKPDAYVLLTTVNDMVTAIETFDVSRIREEEKGIVSGMVEENNPELGYITLYREDGTGTSPDALQTGLLRTYMYAPKNGVEAYRNHRKVDISEIAAGDSVFLKLDDQSNVTAASAASNYTVKYGKVRSKGTSGIAVEYEDGQQQVLDIDDRMLVTAGGQVVKLDAVKDGDNIRLILQITNQGTRIKEITLSGSENRSISGIYKGTFSYADNVSNTIVMKNAEILDKDRWQRTDQKGFISLKLGDRYSVYANNQLTNLDRANELLRENEVYVAVEKDYGGEEKAVMLSFRNPRNPEAPVIYDDTVSGAGQSVGQITLYKENKNIRVTPGTIVVKNGKLVPGNSIQSNDNAYVVAGMDMNSGELYAGIVNIGERFANNALQVYRGRIKQINGNKDFTVESFSELNGLSWNYWNTPKTFSITYDTRILDDSGVVNQRDFKTYGQGSYKDKTVYVIAKNGEALLVSTAAFSNPFHVKGEIYEITGSGSQIKLYNARIYDANNFIWNNSNDITLTVLKNSVIIKNGKVIQQSELKKGDRIQAMKKDNTTVGDAYILFVEQ